MPNYQILAIELSTDPLTRGYAGMTNAQIVASLNTADRDRWVALSASEIFERIDRSEFAALTSGDQARVDRILSLGVDIQTSPGSQARDELLAIFGAGSNTIGSLAAFANQHISRGQEIGWGIATLDDVQRVGG